MLMFMVGTSHFFSPSTQLGGSSGEGRPPERTATYWAIVLVIWIVFELKALGVGGTKPGGANIIFDTHKAAIITGLILVIVYYGVFYLVLKA